MSDVKSPLQPPDTKSDTTPPQPADASTSRGKQKKGNGKRFLSAYAQTWIGMSPIWLMGEAIMPGAKVGSTFKGGRNKLFSLATKFREELKTSSDDVVVILDRHFHLGLSDKVKASTASPTDGSAPSRSTSTADVLKASFDEQARRAAEVIRAAGQNAIVAVSTSLTGAEGQFKGSSPEIKKVITKHGRDVVVLVDKALKNPIVITGVSKFARSKGIPYSEGLLRLASMGLSKILAALPEDVEEAVEEEIRADAADKKRHEVPGERWKVEELDAEELERTSSPEAVREANSAGKLGGDPKVEGDHIKEKKDSSCIIC